MAVEREELRPSGLRRADLGVGFSAEGEQGVDVGKGLDVVNDGRLAEKAFDGGEGWTCAHFGALAFEAGQ